MSASPRGRDALALDKRSADGQELSRALVVKRAFGVEPEDALVVDVSAMRLVDPSPLAHFCPQLQIVNLRSNMIAKLPRARTVTRTRARARHLARSRAA